MTVSIDIVSDTVCPWCYVGKRTLDLVLADRNAEGFEVRWHPFQLNPDVPMEGVDRRSFWEKKFGSSERIGGMVETLRERGDRIGINFRFDLIAVQPNTLRSHVLLHRASGSAVQHAVKEDLLAAFFENGENIGDVDVLVRIGESHGMDSGELLAAFSDQQQLDAVQAAATEARNAGITGVPSFIVNRQHLVPGAVEADVLADLIDRVAVESTQVSSA